MHANVGDRVVIKGHRAGGPLVMAVAALATTAFAVFARRMKVRKALARGGDRLSRAARCRFGQWRGVSYRLRGRRPNPDVADNVFADRIRSSIGSVEARLDLPRVHVVVVEDHTALLHGDVATVEEAAEIEHAVHRVPDVSIAGDDAPVAVLERSGVALLFDEPDPHKVLAGFVAVTTEINQRTNDLYTVLSRAADSDAEAAALFATLRQQRDRSQEQIVQALHRKRKLCAGLVSGVVLHEDDPGAGNAVVHESGSPIAGCHLRPIGLRRADGGH